MSFLEEIQQVDMYELEPASISFFLDPWDRPEKEVINVISQ